jgi:hypothetical protein
VIDATQAAFFVAPEKQRSAAMWTIFVEEPDPAAAVAERDEIFAQQPDGIEMRLQSSTPCGRSKPRPFALERSSRKT